MRSEMLDVRRETLDAGCEMSAVRRSDRAPCHLTSHVSRLTSRPAYLTLPLIALLAMDTTRANADLQWVSPMRYRVLLTVDPRGVTRSNSPASVDIDFVQQLAARSSGTFDADTIEVVAHNAAGQPKVFDATRPDHEKYLLPWRLQRYYPLNRVTLHFVIPDQTYTQYAVYFDTVQSGLGKPNRYPGMVGDGDWFTVGYGRREINACGYDCFYDLDGDGDLDLFKGGTDVYISCYENVGAGRFVDRGRLTSNGQALVLPMDGNIRSWASVAFCDWDGDGDGDMFVHSPTGPDANNVNYLWRYENVTPPGGQLTFAAPTHLNTRTGKRIGSGVTFVDWDNDGKMDVLGRADSIVTLYRNVGTSSSVANIELEDGVYIRANGVEIQVMNPHVNCADIDSDGDLDLFVGTEEGRIFFFENAGTRAQPVFTMGRIIAFYEFMDARAAANVADFDGDGLFDFVPGRYWERTQWGEQPRVYGRMYKNVGTASAPRFEPRDASNGAPYTERFQIADAVRQNGVRAADWNSDGRMDLIASDTDGFVWFFRNTTDRLRPVFAPGEKLLAGGVPLRVYGEDRRCVSVNPSNPSICDEWTDECRAAGYARVDITDWNNDGKKDLLVADGRAWLWLYLNTGSDAAPVLDAGTRVMANGKAIDGTSRGSVLVCDWNNDGKKDVIFAMVNNQDSYSEFHDWPSQNASWWKDGGFLFYKNTGSDASPVLAAPTWIRAAGTIITYNSRPNLGDFVDWNGDGKKDFIGAEFEHAVHFYRNTGSGNPNTEPTLAAGVNIVRSSFFQGISGAEAIDWNGDGDIDILTGQGHGGSGLRFYERDYINDTLNQTSPTVTVGQGESRLSAADFDEDGDVDMADFGLFQLCFSGDAISYADGCSPADLDHDHDVDLLDFVILQACLNGANRAPSC